MKETFEKTDKNKMFLDVDSTIYDASAILNAMHKFTDRCYVQSKTISSSNVRVFFKGKSNNSFFSEQVIDEFYNELIDQQIRLNVDKEYGKIRDEIVKKAFSPIAL